MAPFHPLEMGLLDRLVRGLILGTNPTQATDLLECSPNATAAGAKWFLLSSADDIDLGLLAVLDLALATSDSPHGHDHSSCT